MRINAQTHNVVLTGVEATKEFSIKPGAHIMYVLSSLYVNPLAALFREYATNMRDAYFASGYVKPVNGIIPPEIFLPTQLDPTLIFKDYGVGMSLDTVMRVFTTYGDSTKGESNDETGGFGLGSKSAYCYQSGQHWTVESRFNGEKHSFMMYVNAQNIPEAAHVSTTDTDEPNGVTIMIPILDQHINQVHDIARNVMASYSSIPVVVHNLQGNPIVRVADAATISKSIPGFTYRLIRSHSNSQITMVIMGDVAYELTADQVKLVANSLKLKHGGWNKYRKMFELQQSAFPVFSDDTYYYGMAPFSIVFEVPVGTFLPTPSRDALQLHSKDYDVLANYVTKFFDDLPVTLCEHVRNATSIHEMFDRWMSLRHQALQSMAIQIDNNVLSFNHVQVNVINSEMTTAKDTLYDVVVPSNIDVFRRKLGYTIADRSSRRVTSLDITAPVDISPGTKKEYSNWSTNEIFVWDLVDNSDTAIDRFMRSYFSAVCYSKTRSGRKAKYGGRDGSLIVARPKFGTTREEAMESVSTWLSKFPHSRIRFASEAYADTQLSGDLRRQVQMTSVTRPPKKNAVLRYNATSHRFVRVVDTVARSFPNTLPMVYVIGNPETQTITDADWATRATPAAIHTLLTNLRDITNAYDTFLLVAHPDDIPDNCKGISLTTYCDEVFTKLATTTAVAALATATNNLLPFAQPSSPTKVVAEGLLQYPPSQISTKDITTFQKWVKQHTGFKNLDTLTYTVYDDLMLARTHMNVWNQLVQLQTAGVPLTTSPVSQARYVEAVDLWTKLHNVLVQDHPLVGQALILLGGEFKYNPKLRILNYDNMYKNLFAYMEATM